MSEVNDRLVSAEARAGAGQNPLESVREIIVKGRQVMIISRLVLGLLMWVTVCSGMWLALFFLENFLHLPPGLRLAIVLGGAGLMVFILWKNLLSPILQLEGLARLPPLLSSGRKTRGPRRERLETTALLLERKYNVPENMLVNAMYFEGREFSSDEEPFAQRTINTAISLMAQADLKELWELRKIKRWLVVVVIVTLLWGIYGISRGRYAINALARFVWPLGDVPPAGSVVLKVTPDSDVTIAEGDDLRVLIEVVGKGDESALRSYPEIAWQEGADSINSDEGTGSATERRAVKRQSVAPLVRAVDTSFAAATPRRDSNRQSVAPLEGGSAQFSYTFEGVKRPFAFRVFAADTYSPSIMVFVNTVPRIQESQFHISPPPYTGAGRDSTLGPPEALSGLADSQVAVDVKLDKQAEGLWWKTPSETIEFVPERSRGNVGRLWRAQTRLQRPGSYQVEVKGVLSAEVATKAEPGNDRRIVIASGAILLQQDSVPEIEFVKANRNYTVNPGERLNLDIAASDDFGVGQVYVTLQQVRPDGPAETIKHWRYEGPPGRKGQVEETLLLSTDASVFKPGNSYVLQAFCQDFSPTNNTGKSQPLTVQVRSLDELAISKDDPDSTAFAALEKAIAAQQAALGVTKNVITNLDDVIDQSKEETENIKSLQRHQGEMSKKQERVGAHMTEAWDVSSLPRPSFVSKLIALRDGEHARAMEKIKAISNLKTQDPKLSTKEAVSRSLRSVERLQDFLLEQLIALKGVIAKQSEAEAEKAAAEILGQSTQLRDAGLEETLKKTVNELDEFVTQQKEIMQQRQMIMDKPPEDFSAEDEDTLEALALDQSKLAEILSNVVNDFTNLELLDFGDDAMVESVKSLYEQADKLAEQARKAADMRQARVDAHRLETEAVEMAEELMINCEATLGFVDNVQFIAEIPEDEQLVAPLAELPSELVDLVSGLITSEEEMRQEVEDIGSYLTSLDHTAGPVADGTISSTSAKGKTGDQRPEDNIIQGRSGAGRSGMADGQLVEPVAKALPDNEYSLRERISNTPLESGQVKDEDAKAQTGGTGLGKTTDGASMFGPGGKLPAKVLDMMKTTTGKQRSIRQSAQELVPKLKGHNLPTMELQESIRAMRKVEEAVNSRSGIDIRSAYDQTVNALKKSHGAVSSELAVQNTRDKALAKRLDDMLSQKQRYDFRGYERMISAYFEALAQDKEKTKPDPAAFLRKQEGGQAEKNDTGEK